MGVMTGGTIAVNDRCVRLTIFDFLFEIGVTADTETVGRFGGQSGIFRGVRAVTVEALAIGERFVRHREVLLIFDISMARYAELAAFGSQQAVKVGGVDAVAGGALARFERRVLVGQLGVIGQRFMAGGAQVLGVGGQDGFLVRADFVAGLAVFFSKRRVLRTADQFGVARNMRIMAFETVGTTEVVASVRGGQRVIQRMAGDTQIGRRGRDETGVVGSVGGMAGIALPTGDRFVGTLLAELLNEVVMTGVAEISRAVAEFRQLADGAAVDYHRLHSPGHQLVPDTTVWVMATGAVACLGGRVNKLGLHRYIRIVVARFAKLTLVRGQQEIVVAQMRLVAGLAIFSRRRMRNRHCQANVYVRVTADAAIDSLGADEVGLVAMMWLVAADAVGRQERLVAGGGVEFVFINRMAVAAEVARVVAQERGRSALMRRMALQAVIERGVGGCRRVVRRGHIGVTPEAKVGTGGGQ